MKSLPPLLLSMMMSSISAILYLPMAEAAKQDTKPPNIIFILAEDMGWGDLPAYGHPYARTPNLNKLSSEGTKFNRFYVTGTTCNPSRTGLMTGRNPASFPSYPADYGIPDGVPTVTKLLRDEAGYRTGHVVSRCRRIHDTSFRYMSLISCPLTHSDIPSSFCRPHRASGT